MSSPSASSIGRRLVDEFLAARLMDNNLRGYWCEAMVAEAIGAKCKIVSGGWHAWDRQIGPDEEVFSGPVAYPGQEQRPFATLE